jgi:pilus assembly protein CpaF
VTLDLDLVATVRARLSQSGESMSAATVSSVLRDEVGVVASSTVLAVLEHLQREVAGAGPLTALLERPGVTDVLVNGPGLVYVDAGLGLEKVDIDVGDEAAVRRLAQRLAARAGRRLDDASPWVDARLGDGTRVHAVLSPIARFGTTISLRVPARRAFSLGELAERGMVSAKRHEQLSALVADRRAVLVSGGTGSGKTTLLSALLALVPADERIVVVEDSAELNPPHPHVVGLEARGANVEGAGLVTMRDLVRQALRMRPDRLVVGEVRGAEIVDLLAALNTGHEGGWCTIHANEPQSVPARVEALAVAAGLSRDAVHSQLIAGVDAVVHVARDRSGRRSVSAIGQVVRDGNLVRVKELP